MDTLMPVFLELELDGIPMTCIGYSESISQETHAIHTLGFGPSIIDTGLIDHEILFSVLVDSAGTFSPLISGEHELKLTRGGEIITHRFIASGVQFNMSGSGMVAEVAARVLETVEETIDDHAELRLGGLSEWDE